MLELGLSRFELKVRSVDSSPPEQESEYDYIGAVKKKLLKTIVKSEEGHLVGLDDRLEFVTGDELEELSKYMSLSPEILVEDTYPNDDYRAKLYDFINDVSYVGIRLFEDQPEGNNLNLVMVCISCNHGSDYAIGLVTQQELDSLTEGLRE